MEKIFELWFTDLTEMAQKEILELANVTDPREMNWDALPITGISVNPPEYAKVSLKGEEQYDCRTIDAALEIVNQLKDSRKEQRKVSGDMESGIQYACIAIERRIRHRLGIKG